MNQSGKAVLKLCWPGNKICIDRTCSSFAGRTNAAAAQPKAKAVDFGCEYQSVVIYGTIRIIEDEQERMQAMSDFFDRYFAQIPKDTYDAFTSAQSKPIHVAKIRIEQWFGKQHAVPALATDAFFPDFPAVMEPREAR